MSSWNYAEAVQQKFAHAEQLQRELRTREAERRKARTTRAEMARDLTVKEREDLAEKLIKAMHAGDVETWRLGVFDRDPLGALANIQPHVREKYGFPQFEVLAKSTAEPRENFLNTGVSKEDISERLHAAVQQGALAPNVLSAFDARPEHTLRALPDHVRKAFSIPQPGVEALRKGTPADLEAAVRKLERVLIGR